MTKQARKPVDLSEVLTRIYYARIYMSLKFSIVILAMSIVPDKHM